MQFPIKERFTLTDAFLEEYKNKQPNFGFNGLGEFVFYRTYSRTKEDGMNEAWWETVKRVVEGIYSIQKQHIIDYNLGWNQSKAQRSAQRMYERIFEFKMLGSGRALWSMGAPVIMDKGMSAALYNCCFISTEKLGENMGRIFADIADYLMLGIGVGADLKGAGKLIVKERKEKEIEFLIPDTREGWCEAIEKQFNSYFIGGQHFVFDYTAIRPKGTPIKTFGGISGGYEPLAKLINGIATVLDKEVGKPISETAIADIINMIGVAVVSGNVRRSAEILLGEPTEEFFNLKDYKINPYRKEFGWSSNNSIYGTLGMDYSKIAEKIADNGEPAVVWMENVRAFGRMGEPTTKDTRVMGFNPCAEIALESYELCVTGDTRILTKDGYPKIKEVVGKEVSVWNGKEWSSVKPEKTHGIAKILRVSLSDGSYLDCTEYHKFSVLRGKTYKVVLAKDLKQGDKLEELVTTGEITGIKDENAYEWGLFAGDGYVENNRYINVVICGDKQKLDTLLVKGVFGKPQEKEGYKDPVNRLYLTKVLKDVELAKELNDKDGGIPEYFFTLDKESTLSFIAGWVETDGTIQKNLGSEHYRVYGSKQKMLDLQLLCRRIGINNSSVTLFEEKGKKTNLGERSRDLYYLTVPSFECSIIPTRLKKIKTFSSGFAINNAHPFGKLLKKAKRQKIESVVSFGKQETFCFTEHERHMGVFGNVLTYQCNLVETFPERHDDLEDYKTTLKYAYLFAKTVTLLNTHNPETNKVMLRNRRVGLSMSGIAQFITNRGYKAMKEWMNDGYKTVLYYDKVYSEWFAVPESKKVTTVKPSGTLSLLAGATAGIHFPESRYYIRRVRLSATSPLVKALSKAKYKVEPASEDPDNTFVVEFPVGLGDKIQTLGELSLWEQMENAAFAQENWADNSVSVTVTFTKKEKAMIKNALGLYQFRLKAVSFLPQLAGGAYPQMPYEEITQEEYEKMVSKLKPIDFSVLTEQASGEAYCSNDVCTI